MIAHSEEMLQHLAKTWQSALRLDDWDIALVQVTAEEMKTPGRSGECKFDARRRQASIKILEPVALNDILPMEDLTSEQERIIVHEIKHVQYSMLDALIGNSVLGEIVLEQIISSEDRFLVDLMRLSKEGIAARKAVL